jgi:hypothetical protein
MKIIKVNLRKEISNKNFLFFFIDYVSDFEELSDDEDNQLLNRVCKFI